MPKTKSRRGKAKAEVSETAGLTVAEKRLAGHKLGERRQAVKLANNEGSMAEVAELLDTTPTKAKYLVMQQQVEDGDVPAIKPTNEKAIVNALKRGDDHSSVAWVACRTGLSDAAVKKIAEENGHSFDKGRPKTKSGKKPTKSKAKSDDAKTHTKARRGKKGKRKVASPSA